MKCKGFLNYKYKNVQKCISKRSKVEFCIREALVAVLEINDFKQRGFIALEIFFIYHNHYMNEMHSDSIDWLTRLTDWLTDWLTDQFNFVHFIHFPERLSPPGICNPSFGGYGYFLYLFWAVKQNCAAFVRFCVDIDSTYYK